LRHIDRDDLRVFGAIVRGTSLCAAAKALGIHHSTVARRLEQLEQRLGVNLFARTPLGLRIADDGRAVLGRTERVQAEIDGLQRRLDGQDQRLEGLVRLTMPDAMAVSFLTDDPADFSLAHPRIQLERLATYDALDLGRREADVAIRVTAAPPEFLVGRNLGGFALAVYAAPTYLDNHDPNSRPQQCSDALHGGIVRASPRTVAGKELRYGMMRWEPTVTRPVSECRTVIDREIRHALQRRTLCGCADRRGNDQHVRRCRRRPHGIAVG
jgi:DNA-binding transcriptional LysR family regulator